MKLEAAVVCYPTEMAVAQRVADALGVRLIVNELLAANATFFVIDPLGELDHADVLRVRERFGAA